MNDLTHPFDQRAFEDLEHKAALALKAGRLSVFEWNVVTDEVIAEDLLRDLFMMPDGPMTGAMVFECIHPNDREVLMCAIEETLEKDVDYDAAFRTGTPENFRWVGGRGRVVERGEDGQPIRMMGVNWDMTVAKQSEERLAALTREMDHRVNNGYAIIEAIIAIGAEENDQLADFAKMLKAQIHALSGAHQLASDFLLHEHIATHNIALSDIIRKALRLVPDAKLDARIDESLMVQPQNAAAVSMLMHHICMQACSDSDLSMIAEQHDNETAHLLWTSGVPKAGDEQADPDFLISLCVRQLNGTIRRFANDTDGQYIEILLPVIPTTG